MDEGKGKGGGREGGREGERGGKCGGGGGEKVEGKKEGREGRREMMRLDGEYVILILCGWLAGWRRIGWFWTSEMMIMGGWGLGIGESELFEDG